VLAELTIRDLAIIDELHLRFGEGLNVLTGETGAGKSIIVDAVSLLLGGRGDAGLIRAGAGRALAEGVFRLDAEAQAAVEPILEADGLEGDDPGVLVLSREIRKEGRNICRINGRAVALRSLQAVGECLVDIHGQTEHLSLMRVREHGDLLDRYGGLWPLRQQVAGLVTEVRAARRELHSLRRDERELARRTDLLQYQVSEIDAARLQPGEEQELGQERTRLANAEQLQALAGEAFAALYESGEDQASAVDLLQITARALAGLLRLDPSTSTLAEAAEQTGYQLEDLAEQVRNYRDSVEFNPRRLNQVEERLSLIHNLERRYGESIEDVLAFAGRARQELETIEHSGERIAELEAEEERLLREIGCLGSELSQQRQDAGQRLAAGIEAELDELSMARARFGVDLAWRDDPEGAFVDQVGRNGAQGQRIAFEAGGLDRVEFLVAPNVGEPLKPLVRIASGGETSRLMLALKTVLAQADRTPTLIFDEIDAGIGGRVGSVVGHKLWGLTRGDGDLGRCHQVLCVTHLPQLASYGDLHLHVSKGVVGGRTVTSVQFLEGEALEQEMAGMLGAVTERTRASAVEMLAASRAHKVE
jgi:DNA repair protein RecN (Recombination protein N)